jgi:two-component system CheB/CheR fusion protein
MKAKKTAKRRSTRGRGVVPDPHTPARDVSKGFPIVGMGASAGGLNAFERFFANMPRDSGAAFVLVPHLDPSHASMLPELLSRYTKMSVVQAQDGMKVSPNCVHVIPPNTEMAVSNGRLVLKRPREPRVLRLPIDMFFKSLAEDQKQRAIGIILSGNGTDGTLGLKAIKAELGFAMVQEPNTAEYDSMPRSAISSGLVDYVLPPEKMPAQLVAYLKHFLFRRMPASAPKAEGMVESLPKIFQLLRARTGHDFSLYKRNTLYRRIERRMSVHQIERLPDYIDYIERNPQEVVVLFRELLIGVTNFFRDPQAFEALAKVLKSEVLADKPKDYIIRVWVPGCSSGEEVYSIAMMLRECLDAAKKSLKVQIFGTDIDSHAIDGARAGLYPASAVADLDPARLKRFFVVEGSAFRIKKDIREMAVFALQDVLKEPPFTKLDLLSCRNLLMYFDAEAQRKLLPLFHYALRPNGILFLGSSESINSFTNLFSNIDKKWKIYRRRATSTFAETVVHFPSATPHVEGMRAAGASPGPSARAISVSTFAQKLLVEKYAPPCVLVDYNGDIVYTHGRTGRYLELAQGQVNLNVLDMAREGVRQELGAAIRRAKLQKRAVLLEGLRVKTNGRTHAVNVTVAPMGRTESFGEFLIVSFEEILQKRPKASKTIASVSPSVGRRISQLEQELKYSQESLQTTIEELETSNEELKSSNEELQSTNEELQSTNEELETSKEELQSLNEELVTVNAELQGKIDELSHANDDMKNLLDSTKIATVFLDNDLRIKRFTSEATRIINLIPGDVGRPIAHVVSNLEQDILAVDAQQVVDSLVSKERPVRTKDGRWYLSRIIPYRTIENVIDGVVITLTDISEQKTAEITLIDARNFAEGVVESVREPLLVLDRNLRVMAANTAFYSFFRTTAAETVDQLFFALADGQWDAPALRELLEKLLPQNSLIDDYRVDHEFPKIGRKKMRINARRIFREGIGTETILLTLSEVSDADLERSS